jgi:hypothetical protein
MLEPIFAVLITLQFLAIVLHDWVDIPGWAHGSQVQTVIGRRNMLLATVINALFPGLAAAFAIYYWNRPAPVGVENYWVLYCGITLLSAIGMWYIPYFFGASEKTRDMYTRMYAGTRQVLPPRGDNPRPNLLHLYFHALFVATLVLAIVIRFHSA